MKLCSWAVDKLKELWRWFFPPKIESRECLVPWIKELFPGINMNRVNMYAGMPGIVKGMVPSGTKAIVLPSPLGFSKINVYFEGEPQPCKIKDSDLGLALIAHEIVHVRQAMDHLGGFGAGLARGYIIGYLYCYFENGSNYSANPYEIEAEQFETKVENCLTSHSDARPCDCSTTPPSRDENGLENWIKHCGHIQMKKSSLGFWRSVWNCTPGLSTWWEWTKKVWELCPKLTRLLHDWAIEPISREPGPTENQGIRDYLTRLGAVALRVLLTGGISLLACALIALVVGMMFVLGLLWLILVLAVFTALLILAAILWALIHLALVIWALITGILCILDAIWWVLKQIWKGIKWLAEKIRDAAVFLWNRFKDIMANLCTAAENLSGNCQRSATITRQRCDEWKEEKQEECTDWQERTEEKCTEWGTETKEKCCDWQPCKVFCRTVVTVVEKVCVTFTKVTEKFCVAYTEVVSRTCVAMTTVTEKICVGFSSAGQAISCWARD